jgi:hypothetical protein
MYGIQRRRLARRRRHGPAFADKNVLATFQLARFLVEEAARLLKKNDFKKE